MADANDISLSPVVNRKRFCRRKSSRDNNNPLMSPDSRASNQFHVKLRHSGIPIPIKSTNRASPTESNAESGGYFVSNGKETCSTENDALNIESWPQNIEIESISNNNNLTISNEASHKSKPSESDTKDAVKVFCNKSFKSSDSSGDSCFLKEEEVTNLPKSSLGDINSIANCVDEINETCNLLDSGEASSNTSKNVIRLNLTESVKDQFRSVPLKDNEIADFEGFASADIETTNAEYLQCKQVHKKLKDDLQNAKSLHDTEQQSKQLNIPFVSLNENKNGMQINTSQSSQISVSPNKRVQINIGYKRIKINIKADSKVVGKREKSPVVPSISLDNKENAQFGFRTASGKEIRIDEAKLAAANQWVNSKLDAEETDTSWTLARLEEEFRNLGNASDSTTGLKSMSSSKLNCNASDETKFDDSDTFTREMSNEPAFGGFASAAGNAIKLSSSKLEKAAKLFDIHTMDDPTTCHPPIEHLNRPTKRCLFSVNDESQEEETFIANHKRKVLKPMSANKRLRCDTFVDSSETASKPSINDVEVELRQSTNCNTFEFGKIPNFNFDFTAPGFKTASDKEIALDVDKLKQAAMKFSDDEGHSVPFHAVKEDKIEDDTAAIKLQSLNEYLSQNVTASSILNEVESEKTVTEFHNSENLPPEGFSTASGRRLIINADKLKQAATKLSAEHDSFDGFTAAIKLKSLNEYLSQNVTASSILNEVESEKTVAEFHKSENLPSEGFATASGRCLIVNADKLKQAATKLSAENDSFDGFSTAAGKPLIIDAEKLKQSKAKLDEMSDLDVDRNVAIEKVQNIVTPVKPKEMAVNQNTSNSRKLGMGRITPMFNISDARLESTKLLFSECDKDLSFATPAKTSNITYSTPNRFSVAQSSHFTPQINRSAIMKDIISLDLSPINTHKINTDKAIVSEQQSPEEDESSLVFHEKSCSNFKTLQNDIDLQYLSLKRKIQILEERKDALEEQKLVIDTSNQHHIRPRLGILSIAKKSRKRMALSTLQPIANDRHNHPTSCDRKILQITPKNADEIHFNAAKNEKAVIKTIDGAVVIPNIRNTIGVTEISNAFQAMPGVDPKLIPKGWVGNHYKWIVWKLASYDRTFQFKDTLSIENIIQQMKYRYDREIDGASRPALRRILEKDDVASKRLVLCVAEIIAVACNKFELCLTDGWYGVRTIIDALLCREIEKRTIVEGTKLIVQGAELVDCEGSHPLEARDHVKLRIGYNSTRRVQWHTRLGYYHFPIPFPMLLSSLHPDGGLIACVKVYIVRIYPVRYFEDFNGVKIWRNEKAEEKRCREFENERANEVEQIKKQVFAQFESCEKLNMDATLDKHNLRDVTCPKTLYHLIKNANDPEGIFEMLSAQQKSLVLEYKNRAEMENHENMSRQMRKSIEQLKLQKRSSTPVVKMLVTDALVETGKCFVLNVWKPAEEQLQMFAEECCMSVYNVVLKKTNELSTVSRSMFKMHHGATMKRAQRHVLPISLTIDVYNKPCFNEFDTVGIIIGFTINHNDQDLWLADFVGRLLYVRIVEGPKICALLTNIKVGQIVTASNLILQKPHTGFGHALANQFTLISQFPSQKYLQVGLELFRSQLKDMPGIVKECQQRIVTLRFLTDHQRGRNDQDLTISNTSIQQTSLDADSFDDSTIPSCLTLTDVAMSMIDTDQFI